MKHELVHSKLYEFAHACSCFDLLAHTKAGVPTHAAYVAETFRRRKDGEEWALEMEHDIDRHASSNPGAPGTVRTRSKGEAGSCRKAKQRGA